MKVAAELESELIQEMHLTITEKSGETVYDDNLDPDSLSKFQFCENMVRERKTRFLSPYQSQRIWTTHMRGKTVL